MTASAPVDAHLAKAVLSMEQVRFRWPQGQRDVLHIPELSLEAGERLFIKGSSGSGKTTLLSLIGGVNSPQQGHVKLLDQDLLALRQGRRDQFRADHIGFIFQQFNLIPYLSVLDNILLSCRFSPRRTERALARSGTLQQEAQRLLQHLQLQDPGLCQRPVLELSVGQQQRVACARALIGEPELIIADEPTSALDADARQSFLQLLLDECAACGSSVLFVSHDTSLENAFDRSVNLHELNLAADGVSTTREVV